MRKHLAFMIVVLGLCVAGRVQAEMSSANFSINWDTLSVGGLDTSSSASYLLRDTVGNLAGGLSTSSSYRVNSGYRQGIFDQLITFDFAGQRNSSEVQATDFTGNTISVSSTSPFEAGDYVVLVQNRGGSQVSGVGIIQSIGSGTITVSDLVGGSPIIDGSNDYLYALDASSLNFGTLSDASVTTRIVGFLVASELPNG